MHYDPNEIFVATGIRNFKPTLLAAYREYIQNNDRRKHLHNLLEDLRAKGYIIPEPKYKRMPRDCNKDDKYSYLYLMGQIYCAQSFTPDETFFSEAIIYKNFEIYKDTLALQQWLYELTLRCDTSKDAF